MIPLILKLKKNVHREIAKAQDIIVKALFKIFDNAALHGGTAIWRCYQGNRFSEDVDAYLPKKPEKIGLFFKELEKSGFIIEKKKIGENSIYSALRLNQITVRFEALFKKADGSLREYETAEGNMLTIYALSPEELIAEKVDTYLKRKKIRDFYDIFFLLRHTKNKNAVTNKLKELIVHFTPPIDEENLKVIILEGLTPNSAKMLEYIKDWVK